MSRVTTSGSGLVFDDERLGPPIVFGPAVLTLFINRRIRHILNFYVTANHIVCLENNRQAATYDALLPLAMAHITLDARPTLTGPNAHSARATWQAYLAAPGIVMEMARYTGRPPRVMRIRIRGDVNYARQI